MSLRKEFVIEKISDDIAPKTLKAGRGIMHLCPQ